MRLDATALCQKRRQLLALEHPPGLSYSLEENGQCFVVELVRSLRSALARQQPRKAFALEHLLCDIEDGPGQAKGLSGFHHRTTFFLDASQHLVLDLDQIVWIEERAVEKEGIDDSLRMGMVGALSGQGLLTACTLIRTLCHLCLYNYVPMHQRRQSLSDILLLLSLILFRKQGSPDVDIRCSRKERAHFYQDTMDIIRLTCRALLQCRLFVDQSAQLTQPIRTEQGATGADCSQQIGLVNISPLQR